MATVSLRTKTRISYIKKELTQLPHHLGLNFIEDEIIKAENHQAPYDKNFSVEELNEVKQFLYHLKKTYDHHLETNAPSLLEQIWAWTQESLPYLIFGLVLTAAFFFDLSLFAKDKSQDVLNFNQGPKNPLTLDGHVNHILDVIWSPDGKKVISGSHDQTIRIWDASTKKNLSTLENTGKIFSLAMTPNQKHILYGANDGTIRIWNLKKNHPKPRDYLGMHSESTHLVLSLAISRDGKYVVSGGTDGKVMVWDFATKKRLRTFDKHSDRVTSVAISSDDKYIASASWDRSVKVWDFLSKKITFQTKSELLYGITSVAFSPDQKHIAFGSFDSTVSVWNIHTKKKVFVSSSANITKSFVTDVSWGPKGKYLAGAYDNSIIIWNASSSFQEELKLTGHLDNISSLSWDSEGKRIVSASYMSKSLPEIKIWTLESGPKIYKL